MHNACIETTYKVLPVAIEGSSKGITRTGNQRQAYYDTVVIHWLITYVVD